MVSNLAKTLPATELISKNICPIKKEYVAYEPSRIYSEPSTVVAAKSPVESGKQRKHKVPLHTAFAMSVISSRQ